MKTAVDTERLKENLELFSFPRLSGTEHEKKAFTIAIKKIEDLNLKPEIQNFKFSIFYSRIYPKIMYPLIFWIFFVLLLNLSLEFFLINMIIVACIFIPCFILTRKPENIRIGKVLDSQNLYVKLTSNAKGIDNPKQSNKNEINYFFMAHIDSKGQTITVRLRAFGILYFTVSIIMLSIVLFLRMILPEQFYLLFTFIGITPLAIIFVIVVMFTFNRTNNKSPGVIDNASGIVCVLELLNYYSKSRDIPENANLWFILTGAEETGTMGIRYFHRVLDGIDRTTAIVHNFESLGDNVNVIMTKSINREKPDIYDLFLEKASEKGFRAATIPFNRGTHTDGIYLARKKFHTIEYQSRLVGRYMHSENDSVDNVDTALLAKLCEFIIDSLSELKLN